MRRTPDRSPRQLYLAALAIAVLCYAALGAVLGILPRYVPERLGGGPAAVGLAVGAPALTALLMRPVGGRIADRIGPFIPLVSGAGLMAAGALPAALSSSLGLLLASRLLVGAGEGVMMASTVLWLLRLARPERRGRALGHIGLANYAGLALGPLLAQALGGVAASEAVLWTAVLLPLLAVIAAVAVRESGGFVGAGIGRRAETVRSGHTSTATLLRLTAPAGCGLLLVNVGYVSVLSFGAVVARANGTGVGAAVVPIFAASVVVARTAGGAIPDRLGGRTTVAIFGALEGLGLAGFALAAAPVTAAAALICLAVGQAMAVPGLGLLALARVSPADHGAAAGLFFAWFDAGVGFGGPAVGGAAAFGGPEAALLMAAASLAVVAVGALGVGVGGRRAGQTQLAVR
jgi:predicted MFS family arabinose efflux permease